MKNLKIALLLLATMQLVGGFAQVSGPKPPMAQRVPYTIKGSFGDREDPYYWLKNRDDSKVIDYLKAENAYLAEVMAPTKPLQEKLYNEMVGRIEEDESSVPYKKGNYYYYTRYVKGGEYPLVCRKKQRLPHLKKLLLMAMN